MRTPSKAMLCSKLAIATAMVVGATPAAAQSFLGTVGPGTIGATVDQSVANQTTVTVNQSQAVINWTATGPSGGGFTTFQSAGTTATFQGATDYAVLNRVAPTTAGDIIYMNGTINSLVGDVRGGTVYFYSPNGLVIGDSARIDVGSLGLTTSPIANDAGGNWMSGFGTASPQVTFGASNAGSYVRIDNLAEVNANGSGNYVALVAPHVALNGTIRTDGAAALVGATAATITFRTSNLFDIQVTTGSGDSTGVVANGGTIERNSQVIGGDHRAYLVAVPANNAMTMLVQGGADLGFDIAGSAGVEGNAVVLSAGRNVFNGEDVGPPNAGASMTIDNAAFTSNTLTHATDTIQVSSWNGATSFSASLDATASNQVSVQATQNALNIGTTLVANADNVGANAVGGDVSIGAYNGATMSVGGEVTLSANGFGFSALDDFTDAGHGTGGTMLVQASGGGTVSIGGGLVGKADGKGGDHGYSNGAAGNGAGGTIQILSNDAASRITVAGMTDLTAYGTGGTTVECTSCSVTGGDGTGGTINVIADGGDANTLIFGSGLWAIASGVGGAGDAGAGFGQGGTSYLASANGGIVNSNSWLILFADGVGGNHLGAGTAGSGTGGTANIGSFGTGGGQINIAESGFDYLYVTAEGYGGNATAAGGNGGTGTGGWASVDAPGATLMAEGDLYVSAFARGGSATDGSGGNAVGGHSAVKALGVDATITGELSQLAWAEGGSGVTGGTADGGLIELHADNGATLTVGGLAIQRAYGHGGDSNVGTGATGDGGSVSLFAANGSTLSIYEEDGVASAVGGDGETGGMATGGTVDISTATGGAIDVTYQLDAEAEADGGVGFTGNGGNADAGSITLLANAGTISIDDLVNLSVYGEGGGTDGAVSSGGLGQGGTISVGADQGGTLTVLSSFLASAVGEGGGAFNVGASSGDGIGGTIDFRATGANSILDARFFAALDASGKGGVTGGDCTECGGAGGDGTGGFIYVQTSGGLGNRVLVGDDLSLTADGDGSSGYGGAGGSGFGGEAYVNVNDDGVIDVAGDLNIVATGEGGYQSNGGLAGHGTGGDTGIHLNGTALAQLAVGGATFLSTDGYGGGTGTVASGTAGNGFGGWSRIFGTGGSADFTGTVTISANGTGGDAFAGTGGNGTGGRTRLNTEGVQFHLAADLNLSATSTGGSGTSGGDALALFDDTPDDPAVTDALILARNGSITVLGATSLDVSASGGSGSAGGSGGDAGSGAATVHARNGDLGSSAITLQGLAINASATGGAGGAGLSGMDGGAGGAATGGFIAVIASAGNGHLDVGAVNIDGTATGGAGGDGGGNGDIGPGGNGGIGGAADGVGMGIGTTSGGAEALDINEGSASFASINSVLDAIGGAGGWGGSGTTNGVGGAGGAALGGDAYLNARGGLVTVGDVTFTGHATGGDGGRNPFEALSGAGGNATAGGLGISAINRTGNEAMRGEINAGVVTMTANANGGSGPTDGLGYAGGRNIFSAINSDVTLASFAMTNAASTGGDPALVLDPVYLSNGNVTVTGAFNFTSPGVMSLRVDNGTLSAASFTMNGGNFIADIFNPAVTDMGTVNAGTITLTSSQDVIADANLVSAGGVTITVPGLIAINEVDAAASIFLRAGTGPLDTGDMTAGGFIDARTNGAMTVGNLDAGDYIDLRTNGGITLLDAVSGESINFLTSGALSGGDLTAGNSITGQAMGAISLGGLSAGLVNPSQLVGADYAARLASDAGIVTGSVSALGDIGFGTPMTLTTGNLSSGGGILALVGGATQLGAMTTPGSGYVYLADHSMAELGGTFDNFDRAPILASTPVAGASAITITGNVVTGDFQAAGASLSALNIDAANFLYVDALGNFSANLLGASSLEAYSGGNMVIDDTTVDEQLYLEAGGSITAGNLTAGDSIELEANGAIVAGNLSAGLVNPSQNSAAEYDVGVVSATSVSVDAVEALGWVGIGSFGTVAADSISSQNDVLLLADGNITSGAITTGSESRLLIAGAALVEAAGGVDDFDRSIAFNAVDFGAGVPTAGSVTISGPVSAYQLDILAGTNVTVGDLNLGGWGNIDAGGLLTLNGDANSYLQLVSNDIMVAEGAFIDEAELVSRNAQGTFIGDGLSGTAGYRLSEAEYNRFGDVDVGADTSLGAGSTMLIGDLTVADAGFGEWDFGVYNGDNEGMGAGTIRVVGDVRFTFLSDGEGGDGGVDFNARNFEVDAGTGSISLENPEGGLGGILEIEAQHVRVAEDAILDQLADDPGYAGLADDLATPTETAVPDGVIRAGEIYIYLDDGSQVAEGVGTNAVPSYSVYVQNSGTASERAGFLAYYAEIETPFGTPDGAIDMIVNGQVVTQEGTLTGVAVRDALVEVNDPQRFTSTSTINGCALTGPCVIAPPPAPPVDPTPSLATQITLINMPTGDDMPFGNEEAIEDNEEDGGEDSASSPIQPPAPLFNTRPLETPGDTDEPVSGGGNPALIGNGPNPVDEEDQ